MKLLAALLLTLTLVAAPADDIRKVLALQEKAWNRGDIEAFVSAYENSPDITFVGKEVSRGYDGVLARYRRTYSDKAKMGTLRFSDIEVRMLGRDHALVLGAFHLTRTPDAGGNASGRRTLDARRTAGGWKFIHDHTS